MERQTELSEGAAVFYELDMCMGVCGWFSHFRTLVSVCNA